MKKVKYIGGLGDLAIMNFQPGSRVFEFEIDQALVMPDELAKQLLDTEYFEEVLEIPVINKRGE